MPTSRTPSTKSTQRKPAGSTGKRQSGVGNVKLTKLSPYGQIGSATRPIGNHIRAGKTVISGNRSRSETRPLPIRRPGASRKTASIAPKPVVPKPNKPSGSIKPKRKIGKR